MFFCSGQLHCPRTNMFVALFIPGGGTLGGRLTSHDLSLLLPLGCFGFGWTFWGIDSQT